MLVIPRRKCTLTALIWLLAIPALTGCGSLSPFVPDPAQKGGILVFEIRSPENAAPANEDVLMVSTYNVYGLSDIEGVREDISGLSSVNVWVFQEVNLAAASAAEDAGDARINPPNSIEGLHAILPAGNWHVVFVPVNVASGAGSVWWEGQAVASRFPVARVDLWDLERSGTKHRVAVCAWLDTPQGSVLVVNTDHEVGVRLGPDDREKQVRSLLRKLSKIPHHVPVVVAGDFNTGGDVLAGLSSQDEIACLNHRMSQAGFSVLPGIPDDFITFRQFLFARHLDHLFFKGLTMKEWGIAEQAKGSDHFPHWAVFDLGVQPPDTPLTGAGAPLVQEIPVVRRE